MNSCYDEYNKKVYLIWDEGKLPISKTDLDKVFEVIDDVNAVSIDTWIYGFWCKKMINKKESRIPNGITC
ncbi:CDI toxin immunity protein [Bacillus cereus]|uniref:CDI toxin immunity protein n=1 Tax=Bacillus cereus TaxID=1396 RepID=UPI00403F807D